MGYALPCKSVYLRFSRWKCFNTASHRVKEVVHLDLRVVKVGGSVLRSAGDFQLVSDVAQRYSRPVVVVLSAMSGVTDMLFSQLGRVRRGDDPGPIQRRLYGMHRRVFQRLVANPRNRREAAGMLRRHTRQLAALGRRLAPAGKGQAGDSARMLSWGERLAVSLAAAVLRDRGIECRELLPEDLGLTAAETLSGARIYLHEAGEKLQVKLRSPVVHLVAGFYAVRQDGAAVLLGRGGSDYSAACLAHILSADSLDLFKGVAGFRTADPREVAGTRPVSRLGYTEAAELCYSGADILHPAAVEPVSKKDIPIRIFQCPPAAGTVSPHSIIGPQAAAAGPQIRGIASTDGCSLLRMSGTDVGFEPGTISTVSRGLKERKINIRSVLTSQTCISFVLGSEDLDDAAAAISQLAPPEVSAVDTQQRVALVAVVGESVGTSAAVLCRTVSAAQRCGVDIAAVCAGACRAAVYLFVPQPDRLRVQRELHAEFFGKGAELDGKKDI